jgi:phenylpropionate dioxygenase-like ring-hydroxylating dioxygenase large terminal subunit
LTMETTGMNAHDDPALWNDWQTLGPPDRVPQNGVLQTQLFDRTLTVHRFGDSVEVRFADGGECVPHAAVRHGWIWVCLGNPSREIVEFPRWDAPGRVFTHPGSFGVHASALRCVENFLDMGHFPFVHTDYLGKEPHTEVPPYKLHHEEATDQIVATDCKFWQPQGSPTAGGEGLDTEYEYRVVHPHIAMLKKTSSVDSKEFDVIVLGLQPLTETSCIGHTLLCYVDAPGSEEPISRFQQIIFGQDRPILQSHNPKRLPLARHYEIPVKIDAMSVAYRRWLRAKNVRYGAIVE